MQLPLARVAAARAGWTPIPLSLGFELTHRCNLACHYCDRHTPRPREMTREQILVALAEFVALGMRRISLDGGEPLTPPFNILGRSLPCPSVVTLHDLMWLSAPALAEGLSPMTPLRAAFYRDGIVRALRDASRLIAISHATADAVIRRFPQTSSRIRVVPHGVEPRFRPPADRAALRASLAERFGLDAPYFLVVGQNTPSKNHGAVLAAFAHAALDPRTRLVLLQRLYRDRWLSPFGGLGALARRLGVDDRVVALPGASADEVVELIQGARALVQFSRFEGFGMPALEALACGTPVIASDIPALVEVLGGAALHVPLVLGALSDALTRVERDSVLAAELGARGLERSRDFSWDRSAALHLAVYREAA